MIGQTVSAPRPLPVGAIVVGFLGAAALIASGVFQNLHLGLLSVLPLSVSILLWAARRPDFEAQFTETAVEVTTPAALTIPYETIEGLRCYGAKDPPYRDSRQSFPIIICHSQGAMTIPRGLMQSAAEVYYFLYERLQTSGSRAVHPVLREFVRGQEELFGAERVWTYRARQHLGARDLPSRARAVCLAVVITSVIWIVAGALNPDYKGWLGGGIACFLFGISFYLLFRFDRPRPPRGIRNWGQSSLALGPRGLALIQGDLKGELRWEEIRAARLDNRGGQSFQLSAASMGPVIKLKVEGAVIPIVDLYDRPLPIIYEKIREHLGQGRLS